MNDFEKAFINAEMKRQEKAAQRKAKKAYIKDLVEKGVDEMTAEAMATAFMSCGIIKAM